MEWRIGCSGYHYPDWKRVFYPEDMPQRKWFDHYCSHFNTLELNVTYYKFPRLDNLKSWYSRSPSGFKFSVKAPRHITHFKKFKAAQQMMEDFNEMVKDGLGDKLGCVLYQFPSNYAYEPARLERITELLDPSLRNVLEFRHETWWDPTVFTELGKREIAFCGMSHPTLPDDVIRTTDLMYYRFHGVPHLYNSRYDAAKLEQIAQQVHNLQNTKEAFIYFNNTADGHAVDNAKQLQGICEPVH